MPLFRMSLLLLIPLLLISPASAVTQASSRPVLMDNSLSERLDLQNWIGQMKKKRRGPFKRIRWFCNDGSILAPKPFSCREHDGGVQHGEWTDQVKLLRQNNYQIATLLADLWPESFYNKQDWPNQLKQIMLEQYLIDADDGWILRRARYYRGAIQDEDENWHGGALLRGLLEQEEMLGEHFLLLREAVRLLPHGRQHVPLTEMRQLAVEIEKNDSNFTPLRIKLHSRPEAKDADLVRLAGRNVAKDKAEPYLQLAELIDLVTRPSGQPLSDAYRLGLGRKKDQPSGDENKLSANIRFARASQLLVQIRNELAQGKDNQQQLDWLTVSLDLEHAFYRSANQLLEQLPQASRRQRLAWIEQGINALYGIGFLSERQRNSQLEAIERLGQKPLSAESYQRELTQLARSSRWAEQNLRFHFEQPVDHLAALDPAFNGFFQERLRASPLMPIALLIDSLLNDSQQLRGVEQRLFGKVVTGLQPLNPGLARGTLEIVADPTKHAFNAEGIYLLPETIAELPPVAGILTRNAGNSLSHIQLLARNLGIPNLAVTAQLVSELSQHAGETIILAVSPAGVVQIEADSASWRQHFKQQPKGDFLISPDLNKLDLQQQAILPLGQIRASDSGRIAGPKGANLGELKQLYRQLVPDALVIPFGRFRSLLNTTRTDSGQKLHVWLRDNYRQLQQLDDPTEKQRRTSDFLRQMRQHIETAPLDQGFLGQLQHSLAEQFGADGSYGVFVRSDTNVEDLPNFTGAGLNKTVPHVVGFNNIVAAIRKVWASPFSERAYSWRQAHMRSPEHLYVSVLLMKSVPADKSGVLATTDLIGGDSNQLHVAVNEGVGGAVNGQRAEEILINKQTGKVRLLAQASAVQKRILSASGGVKKVAATAPQQLLTTAEVEILRQMAELLPKQFPSLRQENGQQKPADIEFGFLNGKFILFQIRPLADSKRVKKDLFLRQLDAGRGQHNRPVDLTQLPQAAQP